MKCKGEFKSSLDGCETLTELAYNDIQKEIRTLGIPVQCPQTVCADQFGIKQPSGFHCTCP